MSAIDDFDILLGNTEVVKRTLKILKEESVRLLRDICREYQRTGLPVPDHRLQTVSYLAAEALSALLSADLIELCSIVGH